MAIGKKYGNWSYAPLSISYELLHIDTIFDQLGKKTHLYHLCTGTEYFLVDIWREIADIDEEGMRR